MCVTDFAKSVGAGPNKRMVLQLDNAGWHGPENLAVPMEFASSFNLPTAPNCSRPSTFGC